MKKMIVIIFFCFFSFLVYSNEKTYCDNFNYGNSAISQVKINLFSVKLGAHGSRGDDLNGSRIHTPAGLGFIYGIIAIHFALLITGIIGVVGVITGIPLLAVGLYNFYHLNEQNIINQNLIISGGVTLGIGVLMSVFLFVWAGTFGVSIASELSEERRKKSGITYEYDREMLLINAVKKGQTDKVKELLSYKIDINKKYSGNYTALTAAVIWNRYEIAKLLLSKGAVVDPKTSRINIDGKMWTMFNMMEKAIENENLNMINLLLTNGADLHTIGTDKQNLLMMTVESENIKFVFDAINLFLSQGLDINEKSWLFKKSVLIYFLENHKTEDKKTLEIVKFLIDKGIDINAKDIDGNSALSLSRKNGLAETEKLLINNGAK